MMIKNRTKSITTNSTMVNVTMKNTMMKNTMGYVIDRFRLISTPIARQFSTYNRSQCPISINQILKNEFLKKVKNVDSNNLSEKDKIQKNIVDLIETKRYIESDLGIIEKASKAIEKLSDNIRPRKSEFKAYSYLKYKYHEFLDSDSSSDSESESGSKTLVTKQSEREKLFNLETYLRGEFESSESSIKKLKESFLVEKETRKIKFEESNDESSSKKNNQGVHDFVENLPTDYNPLDDISSD